MDDIFKIIGPENLKEDNNKSIYIGIDVQLAGREVSCPVSKDCNSYRALAAEVEAIQRNLERILDEAKMHFKGPAPEEGFEFGPETSAEEIWSILSGIQEESVFVKRFNGLDDTKRKEVAEHVLTKCNIFSGRGSVFSARYNTESGYME